jgi:multiple sugar transport system permease protein
MHSRKLVQRIGIYVILILIALFVLMPLLWMLSTSFKPKSQWFLPEIHWIPLTFTWDNYTQILDNARLPIVRWFINSTLVATASTLLILALDSLAAYAYARMEFPGRQLLFALLLATLFLPGIMFQIFCS